jgi:site-specific DNA-methyltransferase (adenine-specific)
LTTLYQGNALEFLKTLPDASVDAIITDPPYSSGGFTRSDRSLPTKDKYIHSDTKIQRPSFSGDSRDGRSWAYWCSLWLQECLRITKPSGYCLMFTDWRQLPLASDALQAGGWVWRGIIAWDKTEGARAAHTGLWRHQCEYIVTATNGVSKPATHGGPWPGAYRFPVKQSDKYHQTGKPTDLMRELVKCVPPGGTVLDPFMGSGTTGVAAIEAGQHFIGCEMDAGIFKTAEQRISDARQKAEAHRTQVA